MGESSPARGSPAASGAGEGSHDHNVCHLWRDAALVLICALLLRLAFALIAADTYDPDEFVVLALSRAFAQGATPYHDFMFFHPPGILVVLAGMQPLLHLWWPAARLLTLAVDSVTAVMVWRLGCHLYGRGIGRLAGLLYAVSPVALLSAGRVGQDPLITALGVAGLLLLLSGASSPRAVLAGMCLGIAVWIKYPAVMFLPIYILAAPRRAGLIVCGAAVGAAGAFVPFVREMPAIGVQSVSWQMLHRVPASPLARVGAVAVFWLLLNPLAAVEALRGRNRHPRWVVAGFAAGALFLVPSQVYYHYFVPILPFAALLAAPLAASLLTRHSRPFLLGAGAVVAGWAGAVHAAPPGIGLSPARFSTIAPTVRLLDRATGSHRRVLADELEYPYLAGRPFEAYFWNMRGVEPARAVERDANGASAVVVTSGVAPTYPPGFADFLEDHRFRRVRTRAASVWLLHGYDAAVVAHPLTPRRLAVANADDRAQVDDGARSR